MEDISDSYANDLVIATIIAEVTTASIGPHFYQYSAGVLRRKSKIVVGSSGTLRKKLIKILHASLWVVIQVN